MQCFSAVVQAATAATADRSSAARHLPDQPVVVRSVGKPVPAPSPTTVALYATDWARFTSWCRSEGHQSLPATPETVAAFLLAVASGLSRGSLGRLRAAIAARHRRAGLPVPHLESAARKALRQSAKPKRTPVPPLPPGALVRMAGRCKRDSTGLRDRALLLLVAALPGGRRAGADGHPRTGRGVLLGLDAEHVRFTPGGAVLLLADNPGAGSTLRSVTLPRGKDAATCPVRALEDWLRSSDTSYGPVFRKVDRWGNIEHGRLRPDAWPRILARYGSAPPRSHAGGLAAP